jgi:hypothetical protein
MTSCPEIQQPYQCLKERDSRKMKPVETNFIGENIQSYCLFKGKNIRRV